MPPPGLPDNTKAPSFTTSQLTQKKAPSIQSLLRLGDPNVVFPAEPPVAYQSELGSLGLLQQAQQSSFRDIWPGRAFRIEQSLDSHGSPYTGISFERESLRLSHVPSLGTNPSVGAPSWDSLPDVPEIYGASQWPGITSFSPGREHEGKNTLYVGPSAPTGAVLDENSSGLESLCGTSPVTVHGDSGAQAPSWFDFGNQVTQPRGVPSFLDQMPFFPAGVDVPNWDSLELNTDFQLFDARPEIQGSRTYGQTYNHELTSASSSNLSPLSESLVHYTPQPSIVASGTMDMSPLSQGSTQYTESNHSNPMSNNDAWPGSQKADPLPFADFNYANTVARVVPQSAITYVFPQLPEHYTNQTLAADDMMHKVEENWNCFVMEDGRERAHTPPAPRRKGIRSGHRPIEEAKITAQRRKEGKTCVKCKVARVAVRFTFQNSYD